MRLAQGARVAVIGAGPSGLAAAKHALAAGFDTTVFEAADDLGGQWHTTAAHSGVWPAMVTNTSRPITAFSDFPAPPELPLHPQANQIHAYLRDYADCFGVTSAIRLNTPVTRLEPGWKVDGESFNAVVVASGRFRKPRMPPGLAPFRGECLHAFDYPGADHFCGRRTLVYGNGVSGHEIASDIASVAPVVSAFRKPRYVLQKVVDGIPSDWQWYTHFSTLLRRELPAEQFGRWLRDRVLEVAGNPVNFGGLEPDDDILIAGHSLSQDYLRQVAQGVIVCRRAIAAIDGQTVTFADGSSETVDAIVAATGYELDIPYLSTPVRTILGSDLALYQRTLHPDLPNFGLIGEFISQGPYFSLLELQARWLVALWAGDVEPPGEARMRAAIVPTARRVDPHDVVAASFADQLGVAPDLRARPELTEAMLFGPLLPPRYRLDGPGATPDAAERFVAQLSACPRVAVDPSDIEVIRDFGLTDIADLLLAGVSGHTSYARTARTRSID